jgi:peptidoglycan/LPS O-acetylase OafA/YrhL
MGYSVGQRVASDDDSHAPNLQQRAGGLPQFIAEFDGLRGLAVAGVMLFHFREQLVSSYLEYIAGSAGLESTYSS